MIRGQTGPRQHAREVGSEVGRVLAHVLRHLLTESDSGTYTHAGTRGAAFIGRRLA